MERMKIAEAVMMLPIEQQLILSLRYGNKHDNQDEPPCTIEEIAAILGMTQKKVRQEARIAIETVAPLLRP